MADIAKIRVSVRKSRHRRIRRIIKGTEARPRLCVRRSLSHFYAQLVDDDSGKSLLQLSSNSKAFAEESKGKNKTDTTKAFGQKFAEVCKEKGISMVVFDRGGYLYHGRIKVFADSAKEHGLQF